MLNADKKTFHGLQPRFSGSILRWAVLSSALLAGCATPTPSLYHWGRYQPQVYEYLKGQGSGPEAQILVLEEDLERMRAQGSKHPPGYHAHLGLLYAQTGKSDRAAQEFLAEKELYPESAAYMDFLLKMKTSKK